MLNLAQIELAALVQVVVVKFWGTLTEMAPYLLFGFAVAGAISVLVDPDTVERQLGGRGIWPILKAAVFGIPLPLCSCGVIPVAASLRRHGSSRGATTAFLLSTPQTGVDSVMATYALLGPVFAIFRPLAALVTGVTGGYLVDALTRSGSDEDEAPPACEDECCNPTSRRARFARAVRYAFVVLPRDIGRAMLLGILLAGIIAVSVPDDFFAGAMGSGMGTMFLMMLIGLPLYVCATASVPIAAALILKGVSPGAALVFLLAGPATNAAAITTLWRILGRKSALIYLGTVAVTALVSGIVLNLLFEVSGVSAVHSGHHMIPPAVGQVSAVLLLVLLVPSLWKKAGHHAETDEEESEAEPGPAE